MGDFTSIGWTLRTWNPWRGCTKISPGCTNCYMFTEQKRYGKDPSVVVKCKTWGNPPRWQREAAANNRKEMVFTCSWSDWFHKDADEWRPDAWKLVKACPNLIFQILTKRIDEVLTRMPPDWGEGYPNVALGVSIESGNYIHRADGLRKIPAKWHFISAEPLLGSLKGIDLDHIEWVIAGGESGPNFRNMDINHAREVRDLCVSQQIPFFYKQGSGLLPGKNNVLDGQVWEQWPAEWV